MAGTKTGANYLLWALVEKVFNVEYDVLHTSLL